MPSYFIAPVIGYYETATDIPVPEGHTAVPKRPQPWSVWTDGAWVTGDEPQAPIEERRAAAALSRADFLKACNAAGIITDGDAEEAADGSWPVGFNPFLVSLTVAQRIDAKSTWADNPLVRRDSALLAQIAAAQDPEVSPAQLDAMFGIA